MDALNICNKINEAITYIKPLLPLINCHMVNYITDSLFEKLVPKELKDDIKEMKIENVKSLFISFIKAESTNDDTNSSEFIKYLQKSKNMYLQFNGNSISFDSLKTLFASRGYGSLKLLHLEQFMSLKKSHEVEIMSAIISAMATNIKCTHIIDIGGGKGYLSSMLALEHKLKVLSIDASKITSLGALKRTTKLEKVWNGIRKKLHEDYVTVNPQVDTEINFTESHSTLDNITSEGSLKQVTEFVTENTQLLQMVNEQYPTDTCEKLMIVGLHTCGNLAPSSLKLFVNSVKAEGLINVGCCYHLIDEEFEGSSFWSDMSSGINGYGFPLSDHLRKQQFSLGRNARMLAAQSPERIANVGEFKTESLFFRALLESFLQEKLNYKDVPRSRVGRLANKSTNFVDYIHKSLKKLGIDNIQVNDDELEQFYIDHKLHRELLEKFFIIRLVLAPIVEEIILLDRLLYLHEQGVKEAFIAQLFDPVVSPRCYAIIAFNS